MRDSDEKYSFWYKMFYNKKNNREYEIKLCV